jgi:hypothetical protein
LCCVEVMNAFINFMGKLEAKRSIGWERLRGRMILKQILKEECWVAWIWKSWRFLWTR